MNVTGLISASLLSQSQVLVNSNLGCKVSGFRPLQEDKIEAIYTTLVGLEILKYIKNNHSVYHNRPVAVINKTIDEVGLNLTLSFPHGWCYVKDDISICPHACLV